MKYELMREKKKDTSNLIEQVLRPANLTMACKEVVKNKGAGGVDGMKVSELKDHLDNNRQVLENLIRLGVEPDMAYAWSRSRMGGWAIAQSPILGTTITVERLQKRGYISLSSMYASSNKSLSHYSNSLFPMM